MPPEANPSQKRGGVVRGSNQPLVSDGSRFFPEGGRALPRAGSRGRRWATDILCVSRRGGSGRRPGASARGEGRTRGVGRPRGISDLAVRCSMLLWVGFAFFWASFTWAVVPARPPSAWTCSSGGRARGSGRTWRAASNTWSCIWRVFPAKEGGVVGGTRKKKKERTLKAQTWRNFLQPLHHLKYSRVAV